MVSLINYRSVSELTSAGETDNPSDHQNHQHNVQQASRKPKNRDGNNLENNQPQDQQKFHQLKSGKPFNLNSSSLILNHQLVTSPQSQNDHQSSLSSTEKAKLFNGFNNNFKNSNALPSVNREHFEIRWNNLTYQVEPKWYQQNWGSILSSNPSIVPATASAETGLETPRKSSGLASSAARKKKTTTILNGLNGSVKSGQVTAILGPSGAGKTSLLGCLTGKNKSGVSGSIQVISNRHEPMSICTIPQKGEC